MSTRSVVPADMPLYSHFAPEGRSFLKGEPWPGDAWSEKPGGEPAGTASAHALLTELSEANDRNEQMGLRLAGKDHDLAQANAAKEGALAKVAALEQAARDAEARATAAESTAATVTRERDQARAEAEGLRRQLAATDDAKKPAKAA